MTPDGVYEMNFIEFCNNLSFFKEKEDYIKALQDKANGKMTT